ncbi:spindle assembly abnormal protein 6 homolog isoform X2 [Ischnura elegans]|uniref:spindle assembly abnormal protein 6 homolog isoform X2 n=1 Tax=Ischnura elegans TaxID=197161 RepID=UPI001ED8ACCD|nr:spindle assembly abnormal protein 6 homolog isoform X2 [Ischnura elegans]
MLGVNTMCHGKSKDVLFSKIIKAILRYKDGDDEQRSLRITVERDSGVSPVGQKVLNIVVTDDEDPYFVCDVCISEEEYKPLKEQQNLLVDFTLFFDHVVRLFDHCMDGNDTRFSLLIACRDGDKHVLGRGATLQVMEVTNFKHLCHLALPISKGSDADVKKHMAQKIKTLQEENTELQNELACIQQSHDKIVKQLETKSESCNQIVTKCMEEKSDIQSRLTQELIAEKERYNKAIVEMQRNIELEKQCVEDRYQDIVKNLETQISSLKSQLQMSAEKNSQAEFASRELKKQLSDAQAERESMLKELGSARKQNTELDGDYHEKERMVQSLKTRLAVMKQELDDKAVLLRKLEEENQIILAQKERLEGTLMEKEGSVQRLQSALQAVSGDFVKANEILTMHQKEYDMIRSKLQLSTNVAFEQEKILEKKSKEVSQLLEELEACKSRIKDLDTEKQHLEESLEKKEKALEDKDKRLKLSDDVIERLNRKLREKQEQGFHSRLPLRYPMQRPLASDATSASHYHSSSIQYMPFAPNPRILADRSVVANSTAIPHPGIHSAPRITSEEPAGSDSNHVPGGGVGEIAEENEGGTPQEHGSSGVGNIGKKDLKEKQMKEKTLSSVPADIKKQSLSSRANAVPIGGIRRNPPLSAYFNNRK